MKPVKQNAARLSTIKCKYTLKRVLRNLPAPKGDKMIRGCKKLIDRVYPPATKVNVMRLSPPPKPRSLVEIYLNRFKK